jgi:hypothetical protein
MKSKSGRVIVACGVLAAVTGLLIYAFIAKGAGAAAQALPDTGRFKVGSTLGEERAGFSGRPKVQVFASAGSPDWPAISTCLQSAELEAEMGSFVGVLVDAGLEPQVEAAERQRDGLQVVVRSLGGGFLGGLRAGFTCAELVNLLRVIRANSNPEVEKSPAYASLLDSPDLVDYLEAQGKGGDAAKFVDFLKEFEGASSPAAVAAESRLNR